MKRTPLLIIAHCLLLATGILPSAIHAQDENSVTRLVPSTDVVVVALGAQIPFSVTAVDSSGSQVDAAIRVVAPRNSIRLSNGFVEGLAQGEFEIIATLVVGSGSKLAPMSISVPVIVEWPPIEELRISGRNHTLFAGTTIQHDILAQHADGSQRPDPHVSWRSSDPLVATVDSFGDVTGVSAGRVTIEALFEGTSASLSYEVEAVPQISLTLEGGPTEARTGDVIHFQAVTRDMTGDIRTDIPVNWSHSYTPTNGMLGVAATGQINHQGAYVADVPGIHTIIATAGSVSARHSFRAKSREVVQELEIVGPADRLSDTVLDTASLANHLTTHRIRMYQIIPLKPQLLTKRPGPAR